MKFIKNKRKIPSLRCLHFMKRILSFYLLACIISWLLALPLVLPHFGINLLPRFYYQHALVGLGPIIAAIILISRTEGREGIYSLFRSMIRIDNKRLLLLAVFAPFLLLLLAGAIDYFRTGVQGDLSSIGKTREFPNFNRLTYFAYNLIFFGYGEEVG